MRHINEIKKLIQFPRTQIQLMFKKKLTSIQNSTFNIYHSTLTTQHSKLNTQNSKLEAFMLGTIKKFLAIIITLLILFTNLSCHRTPIEPEKIKVNLIYEDALCTEAYFRLKTTEINYPARVDLYLNKNKVNSFTTFSEDTVFVIENLLPKKSYTSYVRVYPEGGRELVSSEVSFVTMDTTSHNFTWQVFEFGGECGSSVLYDVAIIDENNIWAVGEIYMRDSLGRCDPKAYNAVHWDGNKWELKKIGNQGGWVCKTVFAFSATDIWFEGNIHWDGSSYKVYKNGWPLMPNGDGWRVNKLWGTSSNDLYAVGDNGNIAHWDGRSWKKIESGTELDIYDIYGSHNLRTKETEIYAVAAKQFVTFDKRILKVTPMGVTAVSDSNIPYSLHGVWFKAGGPYYVVGSGMYRKNDLMRAGPWKWLHPGVSPYYTYAIRGNGVNDIFICGSYGELLHFNGIEFRSYQKSPGFFDLEFYELSCRNNLVVAVGYVQTRAVAVIGRRIP